MGSNIKLCSLILHSKYEYYSSIFVCKYVIRDKLLSRHFSNILISYFLTKHLKFWNDLKIFWYVYIILELLKNIY